MWQERHNECRNIPSQVASAILHQHDSATDTELCIAGPSRTPIDSRIRVEEAGHLDSKSENSSVDPDGPLVPFSSRRRIDASEMKPHAGP